MAAFFDELKKFVAGDPGNYISREQALTPDMEGLRIYDAPLIGIAAASDQYFEKMKEPHIVGPQFMAPYEWLSDAVSVVSVFLPYSERICTANAEITDDVAVEWLQGRVEGQEFLIKTAEFIKARIISSGGKAIIPFTDRRFWKAESREEGYNSNWSERHVAFICGLGTFSLSRSLITKAGTAGRFISIVTDLVLPVTEREYTEFDQYCSMCGACIKRCPAGAISMEYGKKQEPCGNYVHQKRTDYPDHYGCGKCQTGVPCQRTNPRK